MKKIVFILPLLAAMAFLSCRPSSPSVYRGLPKTYTTAYATMYGHCYDSISSAVLTLDLYSDGLELTKDNSIQGTVNLETILKERAIELCGEYQRWFDLKRTHTLIDHIKKYNAQASGNIAMKHYYRPIPLTELEAVTNRSGAVVAQDANGVLQYTSTADGMWQNPGF